MAKPHELIDSGIRYAFYALFFFIPLVLYPRTFELFEFNKLWMTIGLSLVLLFLWITKMVLSGKFILRSTPFDIPIGLFLLSQIISTFWSMDPYVSFWGYYSRFNGGLVSLMCYIFLYYAFVSNFTNIPKEIGGKTQNVFKPRFFLMGLGSFLLLLFLGFVTQSVSFLQDFFVVTIVGAAFVFFVKAFSFSPLKKLFAIILTSALVVALWGLPSHFGYDPTCILFRGTFNVSCWTDAFQPTVRLFSTLGQPNWLAAYFSILIPVALALGINVFLNRDETSEKYHVLSIKYYVEDKRIRATILYLLFSILLFIEVLWTQSQSGFLGLLCGLFLFLGGLALFQFKKPAQVRARMQKLIAGLVVLFLLLAFLLGNPLQGKLPYLSLNSINTILSQKHTLPKTVQQTAAPSEELGGSDSGKIRLVVWSGALDIFKAHPLFGSGVETFAYAYYAVKPKEHNLLSEWDYLYNKAHNEYLNYLATTGIVGLGTYVFMIFWFLFYVVKLLLKSSKLNSQNMLVLGLTSGYISILVSNFFGFSVVVVNMFFFIIPGFVVIVSGIPKKETENEFHTTPIKITGLAILGVVFLYAEFFLLRFWLADQKYAMGYNLDRVQQFVPANQYLEDAVALAPQEDLYKNELSLNLASLGLILSEQKQGTQAATFVNRAVDMANKVTANHPQNIVFYKTRIQTFFELSQIDPKYFAEAITSIKDAEKLAPTDAKLAYNEGLLYGQNGNITQAIYAFKNAINLKPNYRDPRYALSVYLVQEAKKEQDPQKKQSLLNEAKQNLNYNLTRISPDDKQSKELLQSIQ